MLRRGVAVNEARSELLLASSYMYAPRHGKLPVARHDALGPLNVLDTFNLPALSD
jgi:hypothetical protein